MKNTKLVALVIGCFILGLASLVQANEKNDIKGLYTYDFGGLEKWDVETVVETLVNYEYAGIVVNGRGESALKRFDKYMVLSEKHGDNFQVFAAYLSHRFDKYGFSDTDHKAAIDRIAGKGVDLWVWARDKNQDGSITDEKVEAWINGIVEYATAKQVKVVLYSHSGTYYPTALDTLALAKKINNPLVGISLSLTHEIRANKQSTIAETFEQSKNYVFTSIIAGSDNKVDNTSRKTIDTSTVKSLEKSEFDLLPFVKLIKKYHPPGPVGFVNFLITDDPKIYLKNTMDRWKALWAIAN